VNRDDEIFGEAIDLPAADRAAFLDRACAGDAALRARVAALLTGHEAADDFLQDSPVERPAALPEEKPGDVLGRYTLLKKIGEGGCGVVYLAEQNAPVRRRVALKIIKLGMDTREVITRFEGERQALAMMDHPDIARVFDAGSTDTGRPFFVMEFVDGVPITKFCDDHGLTMPARLWLFARVCLALQHAHQKGIIHRDLKPSNILVALHEGEPAPKVIDFGIAKATFGRLTEATLVTGFDQFIGTPAYMSPEQAELRDLDIDTRSDVYSLGVLLYELLTGRPPYDPQSLVRAGLAEIRRIIREVDPPRPSTRVATLPGADRDTVARLRGAAPTKLSSALSGDLDWIVMRCLEKDRDRRYNTASELADDVRRHLRFEPVIARPPSAGYRAQKFLARHRLACASAAAVAAALIIGTVVSVRQAVLATRAGRAETVARADAQRRQEQAEDVLAFMLGDFRDDLKKVGQLALLEKVGHKAQTYFDVADPRDLTDAALLRQAKALSQIGEVRLLQKDVRFAEAELVFVAAHARATVLTVRHPREGDMLFERAQAEYWIGHTYRRRGDLTRAAEWYGRYRDSAVALVALDPANRKWRQELVSGRHNLAVLDLERDNLADARLGFLAERDALGALANENPQNAAFLFQITDVDSYLGSIAERRGELAEALARFAAQTLGLETLVQREPDTAHWTFKLADGLSWEAEILAITGRLDEALAKNSRAISLLVALTARDSTNRRWLLVLLSNRFREARVENARGATGRAAEILAATRLGLEQLLATEPQDRLLAGRLLNLHRLEAELGLAGAAARALALGDTLERAAPLDDRAAGDLAQACVTAGRLAAAAGQASVAAGHRARAFELLRNRLGSSRYWRVLDPAVRTLAALERREESRALIEILRSSGYVPLEPWPRSVFPVSNPNP
jgi:serine/threonine-protein kinase